MHTGSTPGATAPKPSGHDVRNSDLGAFAEALPASQAASTPAQRLIAYARASCTVDGYTSFPAYAEVLERLVVGLMANDDGKVVLS